jgi:hypothetical protein
VLDVVAFWRLDYSLMERQFPCAVHSQSGTLRGRYKVISADGGRVECWNWSTDPPTQMMPDARMPAPRVLVAVKLGDGEITVTEAVLLNVVLTSDNDGRLIVTQMPDFGGRVWSDRLERFGIAADDELYFYYDETRRECLLTIEPPEYHTAENREMSIFRRLG